MRTHALLVAAGALVAVGVCLAVYFLSARTSSTPQTPEKRPADGVPAKPRSPAEIASDLRKRYEGASDPKILEALKLEAGSPQNAKALAEVTTDPTVSMESRQVSFELLSASKVRAEVLFPVILKLAEEKNPALADRNTEALASLLERGEKAPDQEKAAAILAAAAKPANSDSARIAAARGLAKLKSKAAVEALAGLLSDEQSLARRFAFDHLKSLAGDGFGYDYRLKPEDQKKPIDTWVAWAKGYSPKGE